MKFIQTKMQIKHPTIKATTYQRFLLILFGLLLTATTVVTQTNANVNVNTERVRRGFSNTANVVDGSEPEYQNVSCISHDAKFICDCKNGNQPMRLPHLIGFVYEIDISNCKSLNIDANTLSQMQGLRKIHVKDVDNLKLEKYALSLARYASSTPIIIDFEKVNFELIDSHAINGNIEEISFNGGRIDVIKPFGFTTLNNKAVLFKMNDVLVKSIEPQAFKKFTIEEMQITNCIFDSNVPSKSFYELEVSKSLHISNVRFKEVHSHSFSFKTVSKLTLSNNYFKSVDAEWIEAHIKESITIRENFFGTTSQIAFKAIAVSRDYVLSEPLELRFFNNTVQFPQGVRPLEFNEYFALNIKQLQCDNLYDCKDLDTAQTPPKPKIAFFASFIDNIYFRSTTTAAADRSYNQGYQSYEPLRNIINTSCQKRSYLMYIILGVLALVIILVVAVVAVVAIWLYIAKKRKRRKMDVVMPEPRTYKETQIVYQIENAGLLKTDF